MQGDEAPVQCRLDLTSTSEGSWRYSFSVSLAQIEYFVAVADHGHVGRAAAELRVAQPAVSRQIRRLEDELGRSLFVRTPRGMKLSDAGAIFLSRARIILESVRDAANEVRRLRT
ncbi:MAG: LysR family transcriptional regulator [Polyangiaceae bacterium]